MNRLVCGLDSRGSEKVLVGNRCEHGGKSFVVFSRLWHMELANLQY